MFGKFHKAKTIELSCPYCGNAQVEPAQVISSFCRECGEHFRVRKGEAIANPGARVSGLADFRRPKPKPALPKSREEDRDPVEDAWLVDAETRDQGAKALTQPEVVEEEEPEGIGAGAFFGLSEEDTLVSDPSDEEKKLGKDAPKDVSTSSGTMATLLNSQGPAAIPRSDRMPANYVDPQSKKRKSDPTTDFSVRCYRCYHKQMVSRYAKSTQCERCSVYISLADYEIKAQKCHTLRTRGNIVIAKRGGLIKNSEIACHNLTVIGDIDARVDCSGTAAFRRSGIVRGQLFCSRLTIDKNCEVRFPDGVKTERADISGVLVGDLTCSGTVRLGRNARIEGNVAAVDIEQKDGSQITGETTIDSDTNTELPLKMGFNPTIIE